MTLNPLTKKLFPYAGKWVAMSSDRKKVLASGKTIYEVDKELNKIGVKEEAAENIIISKMPRLNTTISP